MFVTIYLSATEPALSTYDVADAYLLKVIDPNTLTFTTEYYSNTAVGISDFTSNDSSVTQHLTGSTFTDNSTYFIYTRYLSYTYPELINELNTIVFNLSGIQDSVNNILWIAFDKYGNGVDVTYNEKNFYPKNNDTDAVSILDDTNNFYSVKNEQIYTQYTTETTSFSTTYYPVLSVYRSNGITDIINVQLTVAKQSFQTITRDFRIIDTYQADGYKVYKLQSPETNQIIYCVYSNVPINEVINVNSRTAEITASPVCVPPVIVIQPLSVGVSEGDSFTLSVSATGTTPLTYQWYLSTY